MHANRSHTALQLRDDRETTTDTVASRLMPRRPEIELQTTGPVHRSLFVVDIENSTARRDSVKALLRDALYRLLNEALCESGIHPPDRDDLVDRGDGVLALIRPADNLPKSNLFSVLVPTLEALIRYHNKNRPQLEIRLRMALHAGEVQHDERGPFGEAIDLTCRLLDSPRLKAALKNGSAATALAVSQHLYEAVIRQQHDGIDEACYSPCIRFRLAGSRRQGWLRTDPCRARSSGQHRA